MDLSSSSFFKQSKEGLVETKKKSSVGLAVFTTLSEQFLWSEVTLKSQLIDFFGNVKV